MQQIIYRGSERRKSQRRIDKDQREMTRFELDKDDRRSDNDGVNLRELEANPFNMTAIYSYIGIDEILKKRQPHHIVVRLTSRSNR